MSNRTGRPLIVCAERMKRGEEEEEKGGGEGDFGRWMGGRVGGGGGKGVGWCSEGGRE